MSLALWTDCRVASLQPGLAQPYGLIEDAALVVKAGRVHWLGPRAARVRRASPECRRWKVPPCSSCRPPLGRSIQRLRTLALGLKSNAGRSLGCTLGL